MQLINELHKLTMLIPCNKTSEEPRSNDGKSTGLELQDLASSSSSATAPWLFWPSPFHFPLTRWLAWERTAMSCLNQWSVVWASAIQNENNNSTCPGEEMSRCTKGDNVSRVIDKHYLWLFATVRSLLILKLCKREYFARVQFPRRL